MFRTFCDWDKLLNYIFYFLTESINDLDKPILRSQNYSIYIYCQSYLDCRRDELLLTLMRKYYDREQAENEGERVNADRSLRSQDKMLFVMKRPITEGYRKSPVYRGQTLWNVQPEHLKQSVSKAQFKRNMGRVKDLREKYPKFGRNP